MRGWIRAAAVALGAVGVAACSDVSVEGTVNGDEVDGARDAIFGDVDLDIPFVGSIEYTLVILSDVPDACEVFLAMDDAEETSDDCEELCASYLQIADDHDLDEDEYWSVMFTINTNDGAVGGFDYSDLADETDEFTAIYSRLDARDLVDQASCEAACEDQELLSSEDELPDDGTLELEEVDDQQLPGTFTLEFGGTDALEGSFEADPCDVEELL